MLTGNNPNNAIIDEHGLSQHEPGAKLDSGKLRAALVLGDFPRALEAVVAVGTFGANKYTAHGWLSVANGYERYENAMLRHWFALKKGEVNDAESGLPHLAHFAWNALAILELTNKQVAPAVKEVTPLVPPANKYFYTLYVPTAAGIHVAQVAKHYMAYADFIASLLKSDPVWTNQSKVREATNAPLFCPEGTIYDPHQIQHTFFPKGSVIPKELL